MWLDLSICVFSSMYSLGGSDTVRKVDNNDCSAVVDWWENMRFCVSSWNGETNGIVVCEADSIRIKM